MFEIHADTQAIEQRLPPTWAGDTEDAAQRESKRLRGMGFEPVILFVPRVELPEKATMS